MKKNRLTSTSHLGKLISGCTMVALIGFATTANAQTGKEWDDPKVTSVNREEAHTIAIPMASESDVTKNDITASPYYKSLDGTWKFHWVSNPSKLENALWTLPSSPLPST